MFWDQTILQLFLKGGFAMWPLLGCSVIGAAIMFERALFFFRIRLDDEKFWDKLQLILTRKNFKEAETICRKEASPIARLAGEYLHNLRRDDLRNEILKREGSIALEKVETRLRGLAAITHMAPLLGLLGTVTGLVGAFHQIELLGGQVQPGDLAAGIWEALITTVYGLVIAIPCMAAYHGFESQADRIARRMQFIVSRLDEFFGKNSTNDFKAENVNSREASMSAVQ